MNCWQKAEEKKIGLPELVRVLNTVLKTWSKAQKIVYQIWPQHRGLFFFDSAA